MTERDHLVSRLGEAMDNGEFEMFFQPASNAWGKPVVVESLIRWRHPERGLIPPAVFLVSCEDSDLIPPLGHWILGEAGAHEDGNNAAICRSIISLAHGKDLVVIAEAVELSEEHALLRADGCDGVQDYLFARPAPFKDMLKPLGSMPA